MQQSHTRNQVTYPARKIARILQDHGITITAPDVDRIVRQNWDELSLYLHALHQQQETEQ